MSTYPTVAVTPDGGLVVSARKSLVKYRRTGTATFAKQHSFPDRPGVGWAYPNTGQSVLLPMLPPYNKLFMLSTGGSTVEQAGDTTPASNQAHKIELTNAGAGWQNVGPMPQARVMGDAVTLCDGTVRSRRVPPPCCPASAPPAAAAASPALSAPAHPSFPSSSPLCCADPVPERRFQGHCRLGRPRGLQVSSRGRMHVAGYSWRLPPPASRPPCASLLPDLLRPLPARPSPPQVPRRQDVRVQEQVHQGGQAGQGQAAEVAGGAHHL